MVVPIGKVLTFFMEFAGLMLVKILKQCNLIYADTGFK